MSEIHTYELKLRWTGNTGPGTTSYTAYERNFRIQAAGKPEIEGSSDPHFRGDERCYNPEELFVSAIAGCHMLWYLHLCAVNGVVVTRYEDQPKGSMEVAATGGGRFLEIILRPTITLSEVRMKEQAFVLHHKAHELCFLAASVNFPISIQPKIVIQS